MYGKSLKEVAQKERLEQSFAPSFSFQTNFWTKFLAIHITQVMLQN